MKTKTKNRFLHTVAGSKKKTLALIAAGTLSIFQAYSQTYGSGNLTNGCSTAAGTGGTFSTHLGCGAGLSNNGDRNTFIGEGSGRNTPATSDNVAVGYNALNTQSYGFSDGSSYNVCLGNYALFSNQPTSTSNGIKNTAVGHNALYTNSIGNDNSAFGFEAMKNNTTSSENVAIGYQALYTQSYNLTSTLNTAIGYKALYTNNPTATANTGTGNTAIGWQALTANSTGFYNTATGCNALALNTTGNYNSAEGQAALYNNTTGNLNTAFGHASLFNNTTADGNVAVGHEALRTNQTGTYNTAMGTQALYTSTGGGNTAFGASGGITITTGTYNTCIGYAADVSANNLSNCASLGNGTVVTASNKIFFGDANVSGCYNVANVWAAQSDQRFKINVQENVKGLAFINGLRPVTYNMDTKKLTEYITQNMPDSIRNKRMDGVDFTASTSKIHSGFIAQEVEQLMQSSGFTSSTIVIPPSNSTDPYALNYIEFVVPLVKAVQELSKTVDSLKSIGQSGQRLLNNGNNSEKKIQNIKLALPDGATLGEPQPNPNSGSTQIPYYLPQNTIRAKIIFTDMLGKVMEERVLQPGYGLLNIDTQDLPAGVYSYSLIVNGKVIENKKMMRNN